MKLFTAVSDVLKMCTSYCGEVLWIFGRNAVFWT